MFFAVTTRDVRHVRPPWWLIAKCVRHCHSQAFSLAVKARRIGCKWGDHDQAGQQIIWKVADQPSGSVTPHMTANGRCCSLITKTPSAYTWNPAAGPISAVAVGKLVHAVVQPKRSYIILPHNLYYYCLHYMHKSHLPVPFACADQPQTSIGFQLIKGAPVEENEGRSSLPFLFLRSRISFGSYGR